MSGTALNFYEKIQNTVNMWLYNFVCTDFWFNLSKQTKTANLEVKYVLV